jgi:predicted esterase
MKIMNSPAPIGRRGFLAAGASLIVGPYLTGCDLIADLPEPEDGDPRLSARPSGDPTGEFGPGEWELGLREWRDCLLYVPEGYDPEVAHPLLVLLHGATGDAEGWRGFEPAADSRGVILLIPESVGYTWDAVTAGFGPDVHFIDAALQRTFDSCNVDSSCVGLGGFSDGASYALSLGLPNGDLFTDLIAFSPGFVIPPGPGRGRPDVFVSHGTQDQVLPVSQSRDHIVPWLRERGHDVLYREFSGGHEVPAAVGGEAMDRLVG